MSRFFCESEAFTGLGFTLIFKKPGNICCVTLADQKLVLGFSGKLQGGVTRLSWDSCLVWTSGLSLSPSLLIFWLQMND